LFQSSSLWKTLKNDVVPIVREARQVLEARQKRSKTGDGPATISTGKPSLADDLGQLRQRVDDLENDATKQAELVAHIASQAEMVSDGLQLVAKRINALLVAAVVAITIAGGSFVVVLVALL
jgi:hypothetical protein